MNLVKILRALVFLLIFAVGTGSRADGFLEKMVGESQPVDTRSGLGRFIDSCAAYMAGDQGGSALISQKNKEDRKILTAYDHFFEAMDTAIYEYGRRVMDLTKENRNLELALLG